MREREREREREKRQGVELIQVGTWMNSAISQLEQSDKKNKIEEKTRKKSGEKKRRKSRSGKCEGKVKLTACCAKPNIGDKPSLAPDFAKNPCVKNLFQEVLLLRKQREIMLERNEVCVKILKIWKY